MRPINADDVLDKMKSTFDMQELYLPIHLKELIIDDMPTIPAIIIPERATNGDMVEKIFGKDVYCTLICMMYSSCCEKLKDWWNSPYKKEGEQE